MDPVPAEPASAPAPAPAPAPADDAKAAGVERGLVATPPSEKPPPNVANIELALGGGEAAKPAPEKPHVTIEGGGPALPSPLDKKCCKGVLCCGTPHHNIVVASTVAIAAIMFLLLVCKFFKLLCRNSSSRNR